MFFRSKTPAASDRLWESVFLFFSFCFLAGLFLDGWAHNHIPELETFFTPWHGVFYLGYFATTFTLIFWTFARRRKGDWVSAIPPGHGLSLFGSAIFFLGGIGDLGWHTAFGIEKDIEALLSPTHLILATGMLLIVSGNARHFWATRKPGQSKGCALFPVILSMAMSLALILFMIQFAHFTDFEATGPVPDQTFYPQGLSILGMILFGAAVSGILSLGMRRERLPVGAVTFVVAAPIAALALMRTGVEFIPSALAAGLLGDWLLLITEESRHRKRLMRVFCFAVPALYYLFAFMTLHLTTGVWWTIHMWTGAIVLSGMAGLLTGVIAWPPANASARQL